MKALRSLLLALALAGLALVYINCGPANVPGSDRAEEEQKKISESLFSDAVTELEINVFYEPDAAPYTGNIGGIFMSSPTWTITDESLSELFSTHTSRSLVIPEDLPDMTEISSSNRTQWSYIQLKQLGDKYAPPLADGNTRNLSVLFVRGSFEGNTNVLGVHLSGTHYAFVFKEIVESVGGTQDQQSYLEQAVTVHELGHVLGLVNGGIPMQTNHEDQAHSHHTTNSEGVMYWAVESATSVEDFLSDLFGSGNRQLFGPQSLSDAHAYHP